jgi:hypothetical protein
MAKKAKAKRAKAGKPKKARRSAASAAPVTPTYLPEGKSYTLGLHDVVRALKVIDKHGHMAKFVRAAKEAKAGGTFDAKTVNFVKDFMAKNKMHADPVGKHIVNARPAEPGPGPGGLMAAAAPRQTYNCNFGS